MTFKLDFSQINNNNNDKKEFAKIQDGTYEVIIDSAKQDATPSGADFLDIRLRIRQDFNQSFKNQIIFYRIVLELCCFEWFQNRLKYIR